MRVYLLHVKFLLVEFLSQEGIYKDEQYQKEDDIHELLESPLNDLNDHLQVAQRSEQLDRLEGLEGPDYPRRFEHRDNGGARCLGDFFSVDDHRFGFGVLVVVVHLHYGGGDD